MSRLGAKTYSRKPECRTSIQFDHLLSDKGNKPSTAKVSVAGIHRWGMTSFTSIRKTRINGQKEANDGPDPVKRVKMDTPSSHVASDDPFGFETDIENPSCKNTHSSNVTVPEKKPVVSKPNKFFKSGSRSATAPSNSPKNSDFDALRLSVPTSYKNKNEPHEILLNMNSNFISSEVTHCSNEQPIFLTNTNPNIIDLRYCSNTPDSSASTNYSNNPSVHYISPYVPPVLSTDASSRAFDALRTMDLTSKSSFPDSCLQLDTDTSMADIAIIQEGIQFVAQSNDSGIINSDAENHTQHISQSFETENNTSFAQEICDFDNNHQVSYLPEKEDSAELIDDSQRNNILKEQLDLHSENKCDDFSISQEMVSSQSTDKSDGSISKQSSSSRPKKIFSSSLKVCYNFFF